MCGGMRDAWCLGWMLDNVLSGRVKDDILDAYETNRAPHVDAVIRMSMGLGRVICVPDWEAARQRDAAFFAGNTPPAPQFPALVGGMISEHQNGDGSSRAGALLPHDEIEKDGNRLRLDTLSGNHFVLVTRGKTEEIRGCKILVWCRSFSAMVDGATSTAD